MIAQDRVFPSRLRRRSVLASHQQQAPSLCASPGPTMSMSSTMTSTVCACWVTDQSSVSHQLASRQKLDAPRCKPKTARRTQEDSWRAETAGLRSFKISRLNKFGASSCQLPMQAILSLVAPSETLIPWRRVCSRLLKSIKRKDFMMAFLPHSLFRSSMATCR